MEYKGNIILAISIFCIVLGVFLLFQKEGDNRVKNYDAGGNSVTIIDLTKEEKKTNYLFLTSGILLISIGSVFLGNQFFRYKKESDFTKLTDREKYIVSLISQGMSNKDIGNELSISLSTVKTHINNIYKKLHVTSRSDMLNKLKSGGSSTKIHP